ncbi:DUF397 domain-containing protein [Streptomyces sp. NPDC087850]|uniref:DUF397 domain-containing protein n=1 Tax=unclassified Streptomyces TaxID=2593676 RepID=UPI0038294064
MSTFIPSASALNVEWRKSSYSGADSNCVETGVLGAETIVRDSKSPGGPALPFSSRTWTAFIGGVRATGSM